MRAPVVSRFGSERSARRGGSRPDLPVRDRGCRAVSHASPQAEHFGSTAVPGVGREAIIDLIAAVKDFKLVQPQQHAIAANGFRPHQDGMVDRLHCVRADRGARSPILHVVTSESWPTRNQPNLRNYLRSHADDVACYAQLNRAIVDRRSAWRVREGYNRACAKADRPRPSRVRIAL
ncbi:GrpB family protein [Glycomyces endophyticus]|uniref:GrpB family protein n=1 Tax=Glycomyces endophyticus TaxID=480996 RepID=UPI003CD089A3